MPADVLQEIPSSAVNYFCNSILKRDWPNSIHVYYFIKTMTEWKKNHADVRVSLLCVDGDIEDGTFIGLMYSELGGCTVLAYTQQESCERLARALRETRRIRWSEPLTFEAVLQRHAATVHRAAQDHGLETSIYSQSGILYMPHDHARKLKLKSPSDDVYVAPLKPSHIPYIHSVYAHNDIYTQRELEMTLRLNGGFGVFDADHKLLCWAMHTHYGGVGVLQTRDGYGGKGYARLVSTCISQALGLMGISPHVCVKDTNHRSLSLFRSIGYEHVSSIQYITTHDSSSSSSESSS